MSSSVPIFIHKSNGNVSKKVSKKQKVEPKQETLFLRVQKKKTVDKRAQKKDQGTPTAKKPLKVTVLSLSKPKNQPQLKWEFNSKEPSDDKEESEVDEETDEDSEEDENSNESS